MPEHCVHNMHFVSLSSFMLSLSLSLSPLSVHLRFCRDIFDAMFMAKHEAGEVVIQQGTYMYSVHNVQLHVYIHTCIYSHVLNIYAHVFQCPCV